MVGSTGSAVEGTFILDGAPSTFFDCGYSGYHGPRALANIFLQRRDSSEVSAMRFIPFALYVHERGATNPNLLWQHCERHAANWLFAIHDSEEGDFYKRWHGRLESSAVSETFALTKQSGVIVLGKDTGTHLQELTQVRDYLRRRGYSAELIKDLPEIPMMSYEEKVRLWALVSRFCVMVDRIPAGHISEYVFLRQGRSILALLRPQGSGSTYMIGDDSLVDLNHIRTFEFKSTAINVLPNVIEWTEALTIERAGAYNKAYPWR